MEALVDKVLALLRPLADGKEVRLVNGVPDDLPPIDGDPQRRLEQILLNLVGNAIKFTEAAEASRSRPSASGSELSSPCGIPGSASLPRDQERVFEAFEQGDGSIERRRGGTGLGLAISRCLVEMHGGRLDGGVDAR